MREHAQQNTEHTILLLATTVRDADILDQVLSSAGLTTVSCASVDELCSRIPDDGAVAIISDEILNPGARAKLRERLSLQPVWSDFPIIILARFRGNVGPGRSFLEESSQLSQVLLIKRPTHRDALLSTVSAAIQSRMRQLQVRNQIEKNLQTQQALHESQEHLRRLNETLETRIAQRTDQLQRERLRLRLLAKELTETEHRVRRKLSATIHDGLQQILVGMQMQLSLLARAYPDEAFERILLLLSDALDVSRNLVYELSPPVLHEASLLEALDWLAERFEQQHDFTIRRKLPETSPTVSEGLKIFLFSAVQELLLNSLKHSGTREATIEFRAEEAAGLRLSISDEGQGFDPNKLEATIEPRGFGLFSIRERLEALGGTFEVDSEPGRGARFVIQMQPERLPERSVKEEPAPLVPHEPAGPTEDGGARLRILIADDHGMVREGLIALLQEQSDFEIVGEAEDGLEAVSLAERLLPDVVIMDVTMPNLGGVDSTRMIKKRHPQIHVIGLSLHDTDQVAKAMLQAGAAAFLHKDGLTKTMFDTIRDVCHVC